MVRILSFDVGVRNLAFCEFEMTAAPPSVRIVRWDVVDVISLKKPTFEQLSDALLAVLNDLFCLNGDGDVVYDHVIIENQPVTMNPKIKSVAIMIYTFFRCIHMYTGTARSVRFVSAQRKLSSLRHMPPDIVMPPSASVPYAEKKRLSRELCQYYLDAVMLDQAAWSDRLTRHVGKKDDLCDSFLQGVSFMERDLDWRVEPAALTAPPAGAVAVAVDPPLRPVQPVPPRPPIDNRKSGRSPRSSPGPG